MLHRSEQIMILCNLVLQKRMQSKLYILKEDLYKVFGMLAQYQVRRTSLAAIKACQILFTNIHLLQPSELGHGGVNKNVQGSKEYQRGLDVP